MISLLYRLPLCLSVLIACGSATAHSDSEEVEKVGVAYPNTGSNAWMGGPTWDGIVQAIDDFNKKINKKRIPYSKPLHHKLKPIGEDDKCTPEGGVEAATNLINAGGVRVVIGHQCSGAAIAAAQRYNEHKQDNEHEKGVVLISTFATNPDLTDKHGDTDIPGNKGYVFRMVGRDDQQAAIAAAYIDTYYKRHRYERDKPNQKVAIIHDRRDYGKKLAGLLEGYLVEDNFFKPEVEEIDPESGDYEAVINRLKTAKVKIIYFAGYADAGIRIRKKSWDMGLTVPMLSGDGIFSRKNFRDDVGTEAAEEIRMTNAPGYRPDYPGQEAKDVVDSLKKKNINTPIYPQTLHAYAAVQVWVQAVLRAQSTEAGPVARELHGGSFKTVIGCIKFDKKGDRIECEARGDRYNLEPFFVWYTWRNGHLGEADSTGWQRRALICRAQIGLMELGMGIDSRDIDGMDGKETYDALRKFRGTITNNDARKYFPLTIDEAVVKRIEDALAKRFGRSSKVWERINVCRAQAGFCALGYPSGPLDGIFGPTTRKAYNAFKENFRQYEDFIDDYIVEEIETKVENLEGSSRVPGC